MNGTTTRKFSRRGFSVMLLGAALAGGKSPVMAAVDPAEGYVGKIADEVMSLANSGTKGTALRGRFASVLNRYVNLRGIANFALGPYQKKLPPGAKNEFYSLFNNYAAALFVYYVDDFKGSDLKIISTSQQGKFITITSAIVQNGGGREQVRWRLVPAGGGYKISDINIKGVWLTIATKKRFSDVLNRSKGDFEALFAELREAETW
ncbi:MAG: ABC transporter substrate-binding protein [Aestuariivirga sp.]|nr:ABC transporter substrate-binding protein [Aestuariivirga sp.]